MRRIAFVLASAALAAACVDLFHDTDFTTLCTDDADACGPGLDAAPDAPALADVPLLDFCTWSSAEARAKAEHTCAWLGACEGAAAGSTYGLCMTRALEAYDCRYNPGLRPQGATHALWSCLGALPTVTTCAAVSVCLHGATPPTCAGIASGGGTFAACAPNGQTVLTCALPEQGSPPVASESCTLEGRRCDAGTCVGIQGTRCSDSDTCVGTNAVRCRTENTSNDVGLDCALRGGGGCVASDAGVACAPIADAGACDGGVAVRCDDAGVAHSCVAGRDVVVDCTAVGGACTAAPHPLDPAGACTPADAGARCTDDPARPVETCAEGVIASCARGQLFTLDCARAGLTGGCEVPSAPYIGRARCLAP